MDQYRSECTVFGHLYRAFLLQLYVLQFTHHAAKVLEECTWIQNIINGPGIHIAVRVPMALYSHEWAICHVAPKVHQSDILPANVQFDLACWPWRADAINFFI